MGFYYDSMIGKRDKRIKFKGLSDTSRLAEKVQIEIFRKMEPEKKIKISLDFIELGRKLVMEGIRKHHPEYSDREIKSALYKIILGEKLFKKVFQQKR